MDLHSGGGPRDSFEYVYIEAPQAEAEVIFYNKFGHNPYDVNCPCCGSNYGVYEEESLPQTKEGDGSVIILLANDIDPNWRIGTLPEPYCPDVEEWE